MPDEFAPAVRAAADRVEAVHGWRPNRAVVSLTTLLEVAGNVAVCDKIYVGILDGKIWIKADKRVPVGKAWMNIINAPAEKGGAYPGPTEDLE